MKRSKALTFVEQLNAIAPDAEWDVAGDRIVGCSVRLHMGGRVVLLDTADCLDVRDVLAGEKDHPRKTASPRAWDALTVYRAGVTGDMLPLDSTGGQT